MAVETKRVGRARLQGKVGPGDAICVASPEEEQGKAAHLVSWQGQVAEVRYDDDPENVQTVPRDWVCNRRSPEQTPAAEVAPDGRAADGATVAGCNDPFDQLKKVIPLIIKRLEKEIDEATAEVRRKESELREARRHRMSTMEQRRYEIGRMKVVLKVLSRPRKKTQSRKRR
jgi:hypothetical protein